MNKDTLGIVLRDARGPLNTLFDRLSGPHGEYWLVGLKRFLRKENPFKEIGNSPADDADKLLLWKVFFKDFAKQLRWLRRV